MDEEFTQNGITPDVPADNAPETMPDAPPEESFVPDEEEAPGGKKGRAKKAKEPKPKKEKRKSREMLRIEELQHRLAKQGKDVDPETIVSMYMPRRRRARFAAALLAIDKLRLALLGLILLVGLVFVLSFMQEKSGNFTINLDRLQLYRKGIAISADGDFTFPTARLTAAVVQDATNITMSDLPDNLDDIDGGHNGRNYMAYTYYVRNAGKEDVSYVATLTLTSTSKGADQAARVAVWHNGRRTVYAARARDGGDEDGCVSFLSDRVVCMYEEDDFLLGNVDKYTIVIWLEGEDPECVDAIVGGSVEFRMDIHAANEDDTSLLQKWIQDIRDTLTGNDPISASGTESPDFDRYKNVTWLTRRNQ